MAGLEICFLEIRNAWRKRAVPGDERRGSHCARWLNVAWQKIASWESPSAPAPRAATSTPRENITSLDQRNSPSHQSIIIPMPPRDEWSGDYGCNVQYFSQQSVGRFTSRRPGFEVDAKLGLPEKTQACPKSSWNKAIRAPPKKSTRPSAHTSDTQSLTFAEFYDLENILILGRVTSGPGGEVIIAGAKKVLKIEFPELAEKITLHIPDEKQKAPRPSCLQRRVCRLLRGGKTRTILRVTPAITALRWPWVKWIAFSRELAGSYCKRPSNTQRQALHQRHSDSRRFNLRLFGRRSRE